ncbi:MAG: hypothetical protein V3R20_05280, partial [Sphingomonadales bacterium]
MLALTYIRPLTITTYALASFGLFVWAEIAMAQDDPQIIYQPSPDSPIGVRNSDGAAELAQYDFLIGDWDVEITWYFPGQEASISKAKWHNHWIVDGRVVMLEWRGPQFTGMEIRTWSKARNKWIGVNVYPGFGNRMDEVTAERIGDNMFVTVPTQGKDGPFINRETYYDIAADSYKMKSEHSFDEGKTWER